jgi:hypothetical protein
MSTLVTTAGKVDSGVIIDHSSLQELYSPRTVQPFTPPPTGIDNLGITSTDSFHIPNVGEFSLDFSGFVRVARSKPSASDWVNAEVYTNLIELRMVGRSETIGDIIVTLNPNYLSTGMLRTPFECMGEVQPEKACRMAVGAIFTVPKLGLELYNKEPIELTIDQVRAIPPSGNPGVGRIYRMLPLFRTRSTNGEPPAAYLTSLHFAMGVYLSESEIAALRLAGMPESAHA